jgi:hypothetical protein
VNAVISRNHVSNGNMTIWKGMTIAATKVMKMPIERPDLVRTRTQAACEDRTSRSRRDVTVMMTELRNEEEYCTLTLVMMVTMFCRIFPQSAGKVSGF